MRTHTHTHTHIYIYIYIYNLKNNSTDRNLAIVNLFQQVTPHEKPASSDGHHIDLWESYPKRLVFDLAWPFEINLLLANDGLLSFFFQLYEFARYEICKFIYLLIHWELLEIYCNLLIYSQTESFPTHLLYIYIYIWCLWCNGYHWMKWLGGGSSRPGWGCLHLT